MDKLKMHSPDLSQDNIAKIRQLFPGCVTEAHDEATGAVRLAVDFDQLRQELSDNVVEGSQERYRLDWPGKREALALANAPIAKTLRPARDESVDFDSAQNLLIEGENLEALKLLQETFLGNVSMIYIDPPYNTGKDFIYSDKFSEGVQSFLNRTNQIDENGGKLVANPESNGRFHSDWLTMMYSRLRFARNLLAKDGVIFCSINHREVAQLKLLMDEVFGFENAVCTFAWRTDGNFDNQAKFKYCHEYILAYAKDEANFPHPLVVDPNVPETSKIYRPEIRNTIVKNGPKNPPSSIVLPTGFPAAFEEGEIARRADAWPHFEDSVRVSNGKTRTPVTIYSGWSSRELLEEFIRNDCQPITDAKGQITTFELTASGAVEAVKVRGKPSHVISWLTGFGGSQKATAELDDIGIVFDDYPKPLTLIRYFVQMAPSKTGVFLDFFAGSGTTAHATMLQNSLDGGKRRFIAVQMPEDVDPATKAGNAGFTTIAEITKERIRRAGKKILEGECHPDWDRDVGFRVLKVDTSNMKDVYYRPDELKQADLLDMVDNVKEDRTGEDLLFQVLVDWGVDLTLPIRRETVQGKTVFFVDDNALVACFDHGVTENLVKELAGREPLRVVFSDNGFISDAVKINVEQIFRQLSPTTEVKSI
ncbi:site-specific DNA-methyltransferase [Rhizobium sp. NLR12b]|uniref:site-specific DNA-methyltransferase n=1 Tax=Rhizobium sp. NLR12b TaxID=2731108 RepID=UPI001C839605|nr:site-specific DNA-methyltransferase [Rhizobium sp. NLR12b]MBX5298108.1 site-specific DNA-methyltransferase [Rhizobium sp. NLR12b]